MINANMLIDKLPEAVEVSGSLVKIETNFRIFLLLEQLYNDESIRANEQAVLALNLVFPKIPNDLDAATEAMLWFYRGGKPLPRRGKGGREPAQLYDFDQDDEYIYAAFLSQYGIDLSEVNYMHWWKFRALFHALNDDNQIVRIMGYRSMDLSSIKDKNRRMELAQLKAMYRIEKRGDAP